ncbi:multi-sensor hybrid histidine kinase [Celeribacter indicus]|uniref:histidine kinase n=2 Tax=Celeribacter indicus TaxID=1208324 RepID=A0A0B5E946_9RHOB|nr:multi-sensor hybrid histidine kinase [Celeribacter indicus]
MQGRSEGQVVNAETRASVQTIARLIATDRRPAVLANEKGEILIANAPAQRLDLDRAALTEKLDWRMLCKSALRAGSVSVSLPLDGGATEGEVVYLPLGSGAGFLLRLAETDQEATWLRNRSRAATLMRVAHDLRTPIQSLLAAADGLLDSGAASAEDRETARKQLHNAASLTLDHINNVLAVIRGEQSVAGMRPDEDFNVTEELRTLIAMIGPIARARDVELRLRLDPIEDVWAHGPVRFVRALFQNMIDNAAKYGGHDVEICLSARPLAATGEGRDQIAFSLVVSDTGGGLPPEQKTRLLESTGKGETSPTGREGARRASAGLNVLGHALRQLGGTIEVLDRYEEEEDRSPERKVIGTTLRATFTLDAPETREGAADAALTPPVADSRLDGITVLVVEDSPASRDWLRQMLGSAGATVRAAGNGIEGLALLERPDLHSEIDVILTDMTLPYMNGVEFATRVRHTGPAGAAPGWKGPIVGLTAHVGDEIRRACQKAGIARVLEKPIRPVALRKALLEVLGRDDATSSADAPAAAHGEQKSAAGDPLKTAVVTELIAQFGLEGAKSFMRRAHGEAESVLSRLRADGVGPDTARLLHAATGASGLTGLKAVETSLRAMEHDVAEGRTDLSEAMKNLQTSLTQTRQAIDQLEN